jgi:GNAT superfamily N-acetyltransferase
MNFIKYDNISLINFYKENGLEFDENKGYFGTNVRSFALFSGEKIVGAVSISIYKNKNFIEALAVNKEFRNKGYGKLLIENALEKLQRPVYTISKSDKFYLKNGFIYDNANLIDEKCKTCDEYNITCFPKVLVYK